MGQGRTLTEMIWMMPLILPGLLYPETWYRQKTNCALRTHFWSAAHMLSVFGGMLQMVNENYVYRPCLWLQFESELFLQGLQKRRSRGIRLERRVGRRGAFKLWCPLEVVIKGAAESGLIQNGAIQIAPSGERNCQKTYRNVSCAKIHTARSARLQFHKPTTRSGESASDRW